MSTIRTMYHSLKLEMQQTIFTGIVRSCSFVCHSTADTYGQRMIERFQTNSVEVTAIFPCSEILHCRHRRLIHKWFLVALEKEIQGELKSGESG
ncbi:hypothetical protein TNCV_468761 [Trichonephila clavipes]|nr:hypothetical protein TNCV_468761 [Trichonephila clavipes]